jgi:hypothetical protein
MLKDLRLLVEQFILPSKEQAAYRAVAALLVNQKIHL